MIIYLLISFCLTILIEFLIYYSFIRKDIKKLILYSIVINSFTWPLANLFYDFFGLFFIIEFFVFLVEFILIMLLLRIKWSNALIISLVANLVTMFLGLIFGFM